LLQDYGYVGLYIHLLILKHDYLMQWPLPDQLCSLQYYRRKSYPL
jgi:hypothetical protein